MIHLKCSLYPQFAAVIFPAAPSAGLGWAEHHFYSYERTRHARAAHLSNNAVAAQAPVLVLIMLLLLSIHPVMLR